MLIGILHYDFVQQSIQVVPFLAIRAGYVKNFGHVIESPFLPWPAGLDTVCLNPFVVPKPRGVDVSRITARALTCGADIRVLSESFRNSGFPFCHAQAKALG